MKNLSLLINFVKQTQKLNMFINLFIFLWLKSKYFTMDFRICTIYIKFLFYLYTDQILFFLFTNFTTNTTKFA